jgi:HD-like signal output (HDOD) protein/CheY-like chemotaxis protein
MQQTYRVLVVEAEASARQRVARALAGEGLSCVLAENGSDALQWIDAEHFDVVLTDFSSPDPDGQTLAAELLARQSRPMIVVLTGILDPRLARDLMRQGLDDIVFQPFDYDLLAAKIKALIDRRRHQCTWPAAPSKPPREASSPSPSPSPGDGPVAAADLEERLREVSRIIPISQGALDVHTLTRSPTCNSEKLAATLQCDASLTVEVLRLANSSFYNPAGRPIVELEQAVTRIGQRHVGELALATGLVTAMTALDLAWMDVQLAWHRSVAAGVAAELLLEISARASNEDGVLFGALIHGLGRVVLAALYPQHYQQMIETCRTSGATLTDLERTIFPYSHTRIISRLLSGWRIPVELCDPLQYCLDDDSSVAVLPPTMRSKVELIKLSTSIGRIARGKWEPWDEIELPSAAVVQRLGIESWPALVEQVWADATVLLRFRAGRSKRPLPKLCGDVAPRQSLAYCNLAPNGFDFLPTILASLGICLESRGPEVLAGAESVLVNCPGVPPQRLAVLTGSHGGPASRLLLTQANDVDLYRRFGTVLSLPAGADALRNACQAIAHEIAVPAASSFG